MVKNNLVAIVGVLGLILFLNFGESFGDLGSSTEYGSLNINQDIVSVSDNFEIIQIFGQVENYYRGQEIFFEIVNPDDSSTQIKTRANSDGTYNTSIFVDANWQEGDYEIIGKYGGFEIGKATFQVTSVEVPVITDFRHLGTMEIEKSDMIIYGGKKSTIDIEGNLKNYQRDEPIIFEIFLYENMIKEVIIKGQKNGDFVAHISVQEDWIVGDYRIIGSYQEKKFGEVGFELKSLEIPQWIKNNALWWSEESIGDSDFIQGLQFLITNGIMKIPETNQVESTVSQEIPPWIKNNAKWWAQGMISDDDFVKGIQYLVEQGIIKV